MSNHNDLLSGEGGNPFCYKDEWVFAFAWISNLLGSTYSSAISLQNIFSNKHQQTMKAMD